MELSVGMESNFTTVSFESHPQPLVPLPRSNEGRSMETDPIMNKDVNMTVMMDMHTKEDTLSMIKLKEDEMDERSSGPLEFQSPRTIQSSPPLTTQPKQQQIFESASHPQPELNDDTAITPSQDASIVPASLVPITNPLSPTMRDIDDIGARELNAEKSTTSSLNGDTLMAVVKIEKTVSPLPALEPVGQQLSSTDLSATADSLQRGANESEDESEDEEHSQSNSSSSLAHAKSEGSDVPASAMAGDMADLTPIQKLDLQQKMKKEKGVSCHQCKTSKDSCVLLFCVNKGDKGGKKKRHCRKKYCDACLRRAYNVSIEHFSQEEIEQWQCPACLAKCVCAACSRKNDLAYQVSGHKGSSANFLPYATLLNMARPNNMTMMQVQLAAAATMARMTPEQRALFMKSSTAATIATAAPTAATPATIASATTATAVEPSSIVPAIIPVVVKALTPTPPPPLTATSGSSSSDPTIVLTPVSLQSSVTLEPTHSNHRSSQTVTAMAIPSQLHPSPDVVLAQVADPTQTSSAESCLTIPATMPGPGSIRPRAFSCPTSPTHSMTSATSSTYSFPSIPPVSIPPSIKRQLSSNGPAHHHRRFSMDQGPSSSTTMPQRHRRHSLKVTPMTQQRAAYHGTIAYNQMRRQQQQEMEEEMMQQQLQRPHHERAHSHANLTVDATSEFLLPSSFSQSMTLSNQEDSTSEAMMEQPQHYHRSAPVSPSSQQYHQAQGQPGPRKRSRRASAAAAFAQPVHGEVLSAIDLSGTSTSPSHESQQMMLLSPLQGSPYSQGGGGGHGGNLQHPNSNSSQGSQSRNFSFLQSPTQQTNMAISPNQQVQQLNINHPYQVSPQQQQQQQQQHQQHSPRTNYQPSILSSYLQHQQQASNYVTSPGGNIHQLVDMEMLQHSNHVLMDQLSQSNGMSGGSFDSSSLESYSSGQQADRETVNLHLDLDDPTTALNRIKQLQATLQCVINTKTAQDQAQFHSQLHQLQPQQQQQFQQPQQTQQYSQHHQRQTSPHRHRHYHRHPYPPPQPPLNTDSGMNYHSQHENASYDLAPYRPEPIQTDEAGLDSFQPSSSQHPHGDEFTHMNHYDPGYGGPSQTSGSPTYAYSSSHTNSYATSPPHKHPQLQSRSNNNTPNFLNMSPNTSPRGLTTSVSGGFLNQAHLSQLQSSSNSTSLARSSYNMSPSTMITGSPSTTPFPLPPSSTAAGTSGGVTSSSINVPMNTPTPPSHDALHRPLGFTFQGLGMNGMNGLHDSHRMSVLGVHPVGSPPSSPTVDGLVHDHLHQVAQEAQDFASATLQ